MLNGLIQQFAGGGASSLEGEALHGGKAQMLGGELLHVLGNPTVRHVGMSLAKRLL